MSSADLAHDKPDPVLLTLFANRFMSIVEAAGRSLQLTSIVSTCPSLTVSRGCTSAELRRRRGTSRRAVYQHQGAPRLFLRLVRTERRPHRQWCAVLSLAFAALDRGD